MPLSATGQVLHRVESRNRLQLNRAVQDQGEPEVTHTAAKAACHLEGQPPASDLLQVPMPEPPEFLALLALEAHGPCPYEQLP